MTISAARLSPLRPGSASAELGDAVLVARAMGGDRWAEDALIGRHLPHLLRLVTRLLGSAQDADDVVQDAVLYALEELPKLREPAAFRSWIVRIAVNQTRRVIRRRRLLRTLGLRSNDDSASLARVADATLGPEGQAQLARIDVSLRGLPANERIAWMLHLVEGYTLEEVAEVTACSLATTKRRIAAAREVVGNVVESTETAHA